MSTAKKACILVNLGSPDSASVKDVRRYLKQFLSDPLVIDIPGILRYMLVYGIIAPIRSLRSSRLYARLEDERGFPLIYHSLDLEEEVRKLLPSGTDLFMAMRYGKPSLASTARILREKDYREIRVLPLYPQYASSTTGTVVRLLQEELQGTPALDRTRFLPRFHNHPGFISLWQERIRSHAPGTYDAVVFSYHGIPVRQTEAAHPGRSCSHLNCTEAYGSENLYCYRASCHHTTRQIARDLELIPGNIHTAFQSRFGRDWLGPFTDQTLKELAEEGKKRVLVVSPAFVADCLETTVEIGHEYVELFRSEGGEELTLVPSLNSGKDWASWIARVFQDPAMDWADIKNPAGMPGPGLVS